MNNQFSSKSSTNTQKYNPGGLSEAAQTPKVNDEFAEYGVIPETPNTYK